MNRGTSPPANSTISSNRRSISLLDSPRIEPLRYTFSRPDSSRWKPAPSSSSADMRPRVVIEPLLGRRILAMHLSRVLLPEPFSPMRAKVEPSGTSKVTSSSAWNSS